MHWTGAYARILRLNRGFTDCLLQHGAGRCTGDGVRRAALEAAQRPRVVVMERTNARYVEAFQNLFPGHLDASFISLRILLR
jgi:predicted rRNA methylase YqxC with S4 and FtsJ domains